MSHFAHTSKFQIKYLVVYWPDLQDHSGQSPAAVGPESFARHPEWQEEQVDQLQEEHEAWSVKLKVKRGLESD